MFTRSGHCNNCNANKAYRVTALGPNLAATRDVVENQLTTSRIARRIVVLRGMNVLLDFDLAELYGVKTKALNQAVTRNAERFPPDFMFELAPDEQDRLRSQIVTSNTRGGRRYRTHVFTEQGVAMMSGVLRTPKAVAVNIEIMRAFVELRRAVEGTSALARKLDILERRYDAQFKNVFEAIRQLMLPVPRGNRRIGYKAD
jgi:hypothetical protein